MNCLLDALLMANSLCQFIDFCWCLATQKGQRSGMAKLYLLAYLSFKYISPAMPLCILVTYSFLNNQHFLSYLQRYHQCILSASHGRFSHFVQQRLILAQAVLMYDMEPNGTLMGYDGSGTI
jgi:hypothetical protein